MSDTARRAAVVAGVLGGAAALGAVIFLVPQDRQDGEPVAGPRDGMTSYCLPGSTLRVFERPFPQGGTQPLFAVTDTAGLAPNDRYRCAG